MRDPEKPRHAASRALIELRQAMGKTQQQFAVEVLNTAVTTIGRYETTHPPSGKALLTLAKVAREQWHKLLEPAPPPIDEWETVREQVMNYSRLEREFGGLFLQQLQDEIAGGLYVFATETDEPSSGLLFQPLKPGSELSAGQYFEDILEAISSDDADLSGAVLSQLKKLGIECQKAKLDKFARRKKLRNDK